MSDPTKQKEERTFSFTESQLEDLIQKCLDRTPPAAATIMFSGKNEESITGQLTKLAKEISQLNTCVLAHISAGHSFYPNFGGAMFGNPMMGGGMPGMGPYFYPGSGCDMAAAIRMQDAFIVDSAERGLKNVKDGLKQLTPLLTAQNGMVITQLESAISISEAILLKARETMKKKERVMEEYPFPTSARTPDGKDGKWVPNK